MADTRYKILDKNFEYKVRYELKENQRLIKGIISSILIFAVFFTFAFFLIFEEDIIPSIILFVLLCYLVYDAYKTNKRYIELENNFLNEVNGIK